MADRRSGWKQVAVRSAQFFYGPCTIDNCRAAIASVNSCRWGRIFKECIALRSWVQSAIASFWRGLLSTGRFGGATDKATHGPEDTDRPRYPFLSPHLFSCLRIRRCNSESNELPTLHWSPCHESTRSRFKATMRCPSGHLLTLRGHVIRKDGTVFPSVVCPHAGCSFHAVVLLENWTFGRLDFMTGRVVAHRRVDNTPRVNQP